MTVTSNFLFRQFVNHPVAPQLAEQQLAQVGVTIKNA